MRKIRISSRSPGIYLSAMALLLAALLPLKSTAFAEPEPIVIGLDADLTGGAALGGEAIRRGIVLAMDEINHAGGVLGRPLALEALDHRGNPARGIDNITEFAENQNLVAVFGGVHTPVAMAELETIHSSKIIFLVPWAAGTPIVNNNFSPNYVFRVSVRDQFAGGFLIDKALERGAKKPGLLLESTGWGRSNEAAMKAALSKRGLPMAPVAWFNWGEKNMSAQIETLRQAGADTLILVANVREGELVVRSVAGMPAAERLPIISHWGITGGDFFEQVGERDIASVDLVFLQTFSFFKPTFPDRAKPVIDAYLVRFPEASSPTDIVAPVGTAHAYDLVHLLRRAIEAAGTIDREKVRAALEGLDRHEGLVRDYAPPFSPDRHDALDRSDFRLARFDAVGAIVPVDGVNKGR